MVHLDVRSRAAGLYRGKNYGKSGMRGRDPTCSTIEMGQRHEYMTRNQQNWNGKCLRVASKNDSSTGDGVGFEDDFDDGTIAVDYHECAIEDEKMSWRYVAAKTNKDMPVGTDKEALCSQSIQPTLAASFASAAFEVSRMSLGK